LKNIIKQEGLEKEDRQHYDAGKIRFNYKDPVELKKIKDYAKDDGDDALALFDLMAPSMFYLTQAVPKPFQLITESATGSQVNAIMVRAYLQQNHSIPLASEKEEYKGAISWGKPGIYKNVFKVDVASLYPSIMMQYNVCDKNKDPEMLFPKMVETFTNQRLKHKELAKTNKYYDDLQNAEKILINSAYGFLGTRGLVFNSPKNAAFITEKGRQILQTAIDWAKSKGFIVPNCDTDSISFCKSDFGEISTEERVNLLKELNALFPKKIIWEDDGYFKTAIIIKTKNYILYDGKSIKTKGSALKATTKEKALQEFIQDLVQGMLDENEALEDIYNKYVKEINKVEDITRWTTRKTITDKVLNGNRENEKKVIRALEGTEYEQGDRVYLYFKSNGELNLPGGFDGDYDKDRLYQKLFDTLKTFSNIIDIDRFPNYKLKKNKELLTNLVNDDILDKKDSVNG
jgi:DNA polymerase elongation subunit (family B)